MSRPSYRVDAERHGEWWLLTSPDAPGAVSQVRKLSQADEHAREAIAFVLDVKADAFDLQVIPKLDPKLAEQVAAARAATEEAAAVSRRAAERQRSVAAALSEAKMTGREIAAVLGVTPQRVSQLIPKVKVTGGAVRSAASKTSAGTALSGGQKHTAASAASQLSTKSTKRAAAKTTSRQRGVAAKAGAPRKASAKSAVRRVGR